MRANAAARTAAVTKMNAQSKELMKGFVSKLIIKDNRGTRQVKRILTNPARRQSRLQSPELSVHMLQRP